MSKTEKTEATSSSLLLINDSDSTQTQAHNQRKKHIPTAARDNIILLE